MCSDEKCICQAPHEEHLQKRLKAVLKRLSEAPNSLLEISKSENIVDAILETAESAIGELRERHRLFVANYIRENCQLGRVLGSINGKGDIPLHMLTGSVVS